MLCCDREKEREFKSVKAGSSLGTAYDPMLQGYADADLSWADYGNCYRCMKCGSVVALGYVICPSCGGGLKGSMVAEPPLPRDPRLEPDNGFQCYECGLMWERKAPEGCPACGGLLYPVLVDEVLLG